MLKAVVLAALLATVACAQTGWDGVVTYSRGQVLVQRESIPMKLQQSCGIRVGDRVESGEGRASIYLFDRHAIYLDRDTIIDLNKSSHGLEVFLLRGEVRVVASSPIRLRQRTGDTVLHHGILRAQGGDFARFVRLEQGAADLEFANSPPVAIQPNATDYAIGRGAIRQVGYDVADWNIAVVQYQEGARSDLRLAQLPSLGPAPTQPPTPTPTPEGISLEDELSGLFDDDTGRGPVDIQQQPEFVPPTGQPQQATPIPSGVSRGVAATTGSSVQSASYVQGLSFGSFSSFAGGFSSSFSSVSGGIFSDANQQSLQGRLDAGYGSLGAGDPFPGAIHLVTAEAKYAFRDLSLTDVEKARFSTDQFWSIGVGTPSATQVVTDFDTGTSIGKVTIPIAGTDNYLVLLDQYGPVNAAGNDAAAELNEVGITGLLGTPTSPTIAGAVPLTDQRGSNAQTDFNSRATFALGEFRVGINEDGALEIASRRSAQDRLIRKDSDGNDANDRVTVNPDVGQFEDIVDARFLAAAPSVKSPVKDSFDVSPARFRNLDPVRRKAFTTLVAEQMKDIAQRTGQTRFKIGENAVIDISGYKP